MASDHAATHDHDDHAGHDPADIDKHVRVYIMVFVALMVLTVVTVAISRLHLSVPMAVTVALFVATVKGALVACYFMHLISEKKLILRGPRADRGLLRRAAGASRPHPQQRLLDTRNRQQTVEAAQMNLRWFHAGLILFSAALAVLVGLWCLGVAGLGNGAGKPARRHRVFRRGDWPDRLRLVVPAQDEDAAMTASTRFARSGQGPARASRH